MVNILDGHVNYKQLELSSGGKIILSCTNLFEMTLDERRWVFNLLIEFEACEKAACKPPDHIKVPAPLEWEE